MRRRLLLSLGLLAAVVVALAVLRRPRPAPAISPIQALKAAQKARPANSRLEGPALLNRAAYLPPQCYAETLDAAGRTHNGCFACHQESRPPNYLNDADVQTTLGIARYATENRWAHLTSAPVPPASTDAQVLAWVRTDNYRAADGTPALAALLAHPPAAWDGNGDGRWDGYVPDCAFHPDALGFDRDAQGRATGWRAYAYAPMPGMFWPTNGSAGDAFVRLPQAYREDARGVPSEDVYRVNLAILESVIRRTDVPIPPTDESALEVDLDGDGKLGTASHVAFVWPARQGRPFHYVGRAASLDTARHGWAAAGLFPVGAELLHSVRYLDVQDGQVRMAPRMKELRYMRKVRWLTYGDLEMAAQAELREKRKSPDRLKVVLADVERGVGTGSGWLMQAFIEDRAGALRPQTVEETTACIGCHGGVGATTDSTFSFARKVAAPAFQDGWYHWGERGFRGVSEPRRADGTGEYAHWLAQVGGGDDYRSNDEVRRKAFRADGTLRPEFVRALARDVSVLLVPSPARALALDRAYLGLVQAQRFERGREVVVGGAPRLKQTLEQDGPTGIEAPVPPAWKASQPTAAR